MGNEMKLLMALCDALGFEVEVEEDFDEKDYTVYGSDMPMLNILNSIPNGRTICGDGPIVEVESGKAINTKLITPICSYKLTRKPMQGGTGGSWPRDGCPQGIGS